VYREFSKVNNVNFFHLVFSLCAIAFTSSVKAETLLNSGFEISGGSNPGGAASWYGYTWALDASSNISSSRSLLADAGTGSYGFLLRPDSALGGHSAAWVDSDRYALPGGLLTFSFNFKNISATAPNTWSDYKIYFYDSLNAEISAATVSGSTGYSWGAWSTKTHQNIAAPAQAVSVAVQISAYASGSPGGDAQWGFDNVSLVPEPSAASLLALGSVALLALRRRR
jgi:hypothetical protein